MYNKKLKTSLFLLSSFLLVGCSSDTIVARPTWQNDSIIEDSKGIKDNKLKSIYDAVKKLGDTNSNVLNRIMYDIAKEQIGGYHTLKKYVNLGIDDAIVNPEFKKFVNDHSVYKANEQGAKMTDYDSGNIEVKNIEDETEKLKISWYLVEQMYKRINNEIAEKLYDEIKGGSYSNSLTKLFYEKRYVQHLKEELYSTGSNTTFIEKKTILPKKVKEEIEKKLVEVEWADYIKEYLTIDLTTEWEEGKPGDLRYADYIDRKILPELYKTYLTEVYVKEQRYSSLGRSYARRVNMIAVPYGSYRANVTKMMTWYSNNYITGNNETTSITIPDSYNLEDLNYAMIGLVTAPTLSGTTAPTEISFKLLNYTNANESEENWYDRTNFPKIYVTGTSNLIKYSKRTKDDGTLYDDPFEEETDNKTYVYAGTKLGDMVEKLQKFCNVDTNGEFTLKVNRTDEENTAYNEFTNNQSLDIEESIILKEREMRATNLVKDGWYLKNGGITDLDSKFSEKLFNISTSSIVDNYRKRSGKDAWSTGDSIRYFGKVTTEESDKITSLDNRKAFLVTGADELYQTVVLEGSSNAFIVEVQEAANTAKLSVAENQDSYYQKKATTDNYLDSINSTNKLVQNILKVNSNTDTYKKNANEYYLMISNIVFYDQSVYDYFKSQFPDLFK